MTISNNYVPVRQIGNGVTVVFTGNWNMLAAAYADVRLEDAVTGVQTSVAQGPGANQYQLTFTSSGFIVTFGTAPTASQYAVIGRDVTLDQTNPYRTSKGFQGEVEEGSFDKLTAIAQDLADSIARAITAPLGDTASLLLPTAILRASSFLAFDASGNAIASAGGASVPVSAAMAPVVEAVSLALGRTAFGLGNAFVSTGIQVYTSSGTYTPTTGMVSALAFAIGGGGAGGGAATSSSAGCGGGGGAGALSIKLLTAAAVGASKTVTIGAGGTAGAAGNNAGNAGGVTSLGSLLVADSGKGGSGSAANDRGSGGGGGQGGSGTGDITGSGATGHTGTAVPTGGSGHGGGTMLGGGGVNAGFGNNGNQGFGYGSGGSGGADSSSSGNKTGGIGNSGILFIIEFIHA